MLARHFSRFFEANPGLLHFSAHSPHPWPDATEAAHARYCTDSATLVDKGLVENVGVRSRPRGSPAASATNSQPFAVSIRPLWAGVRDEGV